jgi:hypothetical protein
MNGWETVVGALIGVLTVPLVAWGMALIHPKKIAEWLSGALQKIFKGNKDLTNEVENEVGKKLVEIGQAIIDAHEDLKKTL